MDRSQTMKTKFFDREDSSNPLNNSTIKDSSELTGILRGFRKREPFFCELVGDNGYDLLIGIAGNVGCVQFSPSSGDNPYLTAVAPGEQEANEFVEFLIGGAPT